ncbi:unnamed protein product [Ranitomeya imitator]|uniref:Glucagon receptor n=1 Tax=Ranitomeya imitator TaxID=111125 RepID=A0ABN9MNM7_9NEOB|nr:unnamed protein product [Ranitomeya imitator]
MDNDDSRIRGRLCPSLIDRGNLYDIVAMATIMTSSSLCPLLIGRGLAASTNQRRRMSTSFMTSSSLCPLLIGQGRSEMRDFYVDAVPAISAQVMDYLYDSWRKYETECQQNMSMEPPPTGLVCNRTFDKFSCWPDTQPNTTVNVSCPWFLPWYKKVQHGSVYKHCGPDGQWAATVHGHLLRDARECQLDQADVEDQEKFAKTYESFKIMYTVGYSMSVGSLILALAILVGFRDSIATGSVPQDWRIANVVPIFKKGSKSEPGNYRPLKCSYDKKITDLYILSSKLHCMRNYIHINLFISFILKGVSVLVIDAMLKTRYSEKIEEEYLHVWLSSEAGCRAASVLMQYGIIANYCWLLVEGIYLHNLLVLSVFSERSYFALYVCIGWGPRKDAVAQIQHWNIDKEQGRQTQVELNSKAANELTKTPEGGSPETAIPLVTTEVNSATEFTTVPPP